MFLFLFHSVYLYSHLWEDLLTLRHPEAALTDRPPEAGLRVEFRVAFGGLVGMVKVRVRDKGMHL